MREIDGEKGKEERGLEGEIMIVGERERERRVDARVEG